MLSHAGRLIVIKSVIQSLPVYFMSTDRVPDSVLNKITGLMRKFFWGALDKDRFLVEWEKWHGGAGSGTARHGFGTTRFTITARHGTARRRDHSRAVTASRKKDTARHGTEIVLVTARHGTKHGTTQHRKRYGTARLVTAQEIDQSYEERQQYGYNPYMDNYKEYRLPMYN